MKIFAGLICLTFLTIFVSHIANVTAGASDESPTIGMSGNDGAKGYITQISSTWALETTSEECATCPKQEVEAEGSPASITDDQYDELRGWLLNDKGVLSARWGADDCSQQYGNLGGECPNCGDCKHTGVDYATNWEFVNFHAVANGVITETDASTGKVCLYNPEGNTTFIYLHASSIYVQKGQTVTTGMPIGRIGNTGTYEVYLHLEARPGKETTTACCFNDTINPYQAAKNARDLAMVSIGLERNDTKIFSHTTPKPKPSPTPKATPTCPPCTPKSESISLSRYYTDGTLNDFVGSNVGQCTWYVYGRIQEKGLITRDYLKALETKLKDLETKLLGKPGKHLFFRGNANTWDDDAKMVGFNVDHTLTADAIAVWERKSNNNGESLNHVAFVESSEGGSKVTESNLKPILGMKVVVTKSGGWNLRKCASTSSGVEWPMPQFTIMEVVGGSYKRGIT